MQRRWCTCRSIPASYRYRIHATRTRGLRNSMRSLLAGVLVGRDAMDTGSRWNDMCHSIRNLGRDGIASMAISALDIALWDFKGKALGVPVCVLLGQAREAVPVYGSGGFTSYTVARLCEQLRGWVDAGIPRVKMKVGRDARRRRRARYRSASRDRRQLPSCSSMRTERIRFAKPISQAKQFTEARVTWFEEPVYHQNFDGTGRGSQERRQAWRLPTVSTDTDCTTSNA